MLKTVLIGLSIVVLCVFAYVGYNSYAVGRRTGSEDGYTGANITASPDRKASAGSTDIPVTSPTGTPSGSGAPEVTAGGASTVNGAPPPAADTIAPNPPNGMTFGGAGHYQLYRQGDLTWRLNTDNGETCVIFATDEEWHKPKVYKAGCRGT